MSHRFIQVGFSAIDELTNMVVKKELPAKVFVFLLWASSYSWDTGAEERNPCVIPMSAIAEYFGLSKVTIAKWIKKLKQLEQIHVVYPVKSNKLNEVKEFHRYEDAWGYKSQVNGFLMPIQMHILRDDLRVKASKGQVIYGV